MNIHWFRRDLRLEDNAALYHALKEGPCLPIFIFDSNILDELSRPKDARVEFIHDQLYKLKNKLQNLGSDLLIFYGKPEEVWKQILNNFKVNAVYTNRDYEPYAKSRDQKIAEILEQNKIPFQTYKDHIIFESNEVLKADGNPYVVFTPYKRKWLEKIEEGLESNAEPIGSSYYFKSYPCEKYYNNFYKIGKTEGITLEAMGFQKSSIPIPKKEVPQSRIKKYDKTRDFPAIEGTSKLGIHYRFGTISIRKKARKAIQLNEVYLSELVWRDFYSQILDHFPKVVTESFRLKYDRIPWRNNKNEFEAWCNGQTGYPMVDAGMRELNQTGYMHNRVRMLTASFLTKHLLIDWRWGEQYFAKHLLDYELASNNGGWQWAAGCGTDAAPYFRIFNPMTQAKKFDPERKYIKKWVPEVDEMTYPKPIVDHKFARERCLKTYKDALDN